MPHSPEGHYHMMQLGDMQVFIGLDIHGNALVSAEDHPAWDDVIDYALDIGVQVMENTLGEYAGSRTVRVEVADLAMNHLFPDGERKTFAELAASAFKDWEPVLRH